MSESRSGPGAPASGLGRFVPGLRMLSHYKGSWLKGDLAAGLSVAAVALPVGIAYADLAGVPPVYGIYAAIFPLFAYALFGSSRQLMTGPDAATCIMVAAILGPLAGGDAARYQSLMVVLTLCTGLIYVVAGFARLGFGLETSFALASVPSRDPRAPIDGNPPRRHEVSQVADRPAGVRSGLGVGQPRGDMFVGRRTRHPLLSVLPPKKLRGRKGPRAAQKAPIVRAAASRRRCLSHSVTVCRELTKTDQYWLNLGSVDAKWLVSIQNCAENSKWIQNAPNKVSLRQNPPFSVSSGHADCRARCGIVRHRRCLNPRSPRSTPSAYSHGGDCVAED